MGSNRFPFTGAKLAALIPKDARTCYYDATLRGLYVRNYPERNTII